MIVAFSRVVFTCCCIAIAFYLHVGILQNHILLLHCIYMFSVHCNKHLVYQQIKLELSYHDFIIPAGFLKVMRQLFDVNAVCKS